jgi:hypothetical protein
MMFPPIGIILFSSKVHYSADGGIVEKKTPLCYALTAVDPVKFTGFIERRRPDFRKGEGGGNMACYEMDDAGKKDETWSVGDILRAMSAGEELPPYIERLLLQLQAWMSSALSGEAAYGEDDEALGFDERRFGGDPEVLWDQLEWLEEHADLLIASDVTSCANEDAVVLCLGPLDLDEAFRTAIDHAAIFGKGKCRRVWIVSDSWLVGDVIHYLRHLRVLAAEGITIRFLLVTPWGWTEVPVGREMDDKKHLDWKAPRAEKRGQKPRPKNNNKKEEG